MRCCGGGAREKCDLATPSRPDRNGNHGIKFTSRGFGDKILKFYLLKYNKRSVLSKRYGVKFEILQRKRRLCNARSASAS